MTMSKRFIYVSLIGLFVTAVFFTAEGCPSFPDKDFSKSSDSFADDSGDDEIDDTHADDDTIGDDDTVADDDLDDDTETCQYSFDFEGGTGNWVHGGTQDEWELGTPTYSSGPGACHSGSNCWGTDLDSAYNNNANNWLVSEVLYLHGNCRITYWQWHDFALTTDKGLLEISSSGDSWESLKTFTGQSDAWTEVTVSLAGRLGNYMIRWHFISDTILTAPGWYIDDVTIGRAE